VRPLAAALADALQAQNARYGESAARDRHLAALRGGAAAVVTGQQMGLFLGPLFTLYKAATAVRLARTLASEQGTPVVPVFWLQTEDHDLPEIAHCDVAPSRGVALRLELPAPGEHVSVAHRVLPAEVSACLEALRGDLDHLPHARPHLGRLARHYRPGAGWAEAFAGVLAELFAPEGLVLLDPRDPRLAPLAAPIHRRALIEARPIAEALGAGRSGMAVHVREGAPLFFFHPAGPEGPRYRLVPAHGGWAEVGGTGIHTEAELLDALDRRPLCFSTSALLRPILEDTWLPTAAYVGGPAEVAYFAQLPPLYEAFGLTMPRVVPRAQFRLLEDSTRRTLARRGIAAAEVDRPEEELLALVRSRAGDGPAGREIAARLVDRFQQALAEVAPLLAPAGDGIEEAMEKTRGTVARAVGKLGEKVDRAFGHRDAARVEDVRRLQAWLRPGGLPQERVFGMSTFAARHGERALVERVVEEAEPFDGTVRDLDL
jgi:bacillithiol biosynthesis cysteine-adding enzyme BshC